MHKHYYKYSNGLAGNRAVGGWGSEGVAGGRRGIVGPKQLRSAARMAPGSSAWGGGRHVESGIVEKFVCHYKFKIAGFWVRPGCRASRFLGSHIKHSPWVFGMGGGAVSTVGKEPVTYTGGKTRRRDKPRI